MNWTIISVIPCFESFQEQQISTNRIALAQIQRKLEKFREGPSSQWTWRKLFDDDDDKSKVMRTKIQVNTQCHRNALKINTEEEVSYLQEKLINQTINKNWTRNFYHHHKTGQDYQKYTNHNHITAERWVIATIIGDLQYHLRDPVPMK